MKRAFFFFLAASLFLVSRSTAHVGSPDVFYEGMAGPYRLFVTIRTPPMVPGIAEIEVRSLDGDVTDIRIVPLRAVGEGSEYAPPSDRMLRSQADTQYFTGKLWLMGSGAWQVRLEVLGTHGKGETAVPVPAAARRTLRMQKGTGALLLVLMLLLVASLIAIFRYRCFCCGLCILHCDIFPVGRCLSAVRGFNASNFRSTIRLNPIAAVRAHTIAAKLSKNVRPPGHPCVSRAATAILDNANGSANTVCSNRTNSKYLRIMASWNSKYRYHQRNRLENSRRRPSPS